MKALKFKLCSLTLAESPSVTMRVQPREFLLPASLASSSLGIPLNLVCLEPLCFLAMTACDLALAQVRTRSTMPQLRACVYGVCVWGCVCVWVSECACVGGVNDYAHTKWCKGPVFVQWTFAAWKIFRNSQKLVSKGISTIIVPVLYR